MLDDLKKYFSEHAANPNFKSSNVARWYTELSNGQIAALQLKRTLHPETKASLRWYEFEPEFIIGKNTKVAKEFFNKNWKSKSWNKSTSKAGIEGLNWAKNMLSELISSNSLGDGFIVIYGSNQKRLNAYKKMTRDVTGFYFDEDSNALVKEVKSDDIYTWELNNSKHIKIDEYKRIKNARTISSHNIEDKTDFSTIFSLLDKKKLNSGNVKSMFSFDSTKFNGISSVEMSDDIDNVLKYIQNKFNITIHDVNSFENEASQLISDPRATLARIERWLNYEKEIKVLSEESASKTAIGIAMNNNSLLNAHNKALYDLKKSNPRLYGDVIKGYHKYGPSADEVNKVVRFPNDWNKWYKTWNESGNAKAAYNVAKRHGVYLNSPEDHVRFATFHEYGHIKSGFAKSTHEEVFLDLINKKFKTEHTSLTEAVNGINSTFGEERASNVLWKLQSLAADSDIIPRTYRGKKEEAAADIFAIKMMKKEAHMVGNISVKNASNAVKRTSNMTSNGYKLLSRVFTRK